MACVIDIRLGDGAWPDLKEKAHEGKLIHIGDGSVIGVGGLAGGMESGAPSVMLRIDLPSGETVLAETSLRLFLLAAEALRARFGSGGN
jgi:hypothetical protein